MRMPRPDTLIETADSIVIINFLRFNLSDIWIVAMATDSKQNFLWEPSLPLSLSTLLPASDSAQLISKGGGGPWLCVAQWCIARVWIDKLGIAWYGVPQGVTVWDRFFFFTSKKSLLRLSFVLAERKRGGGEINSNE